MRAVNKIDSKFIDKAREQAVHEEKLKAAGGEWR